MARVGPQRHKKQCKWDPIKLTSYAICTRIFKFFFVVVNIGLLMAPEAETSSQL